VVGHTPTILLVCAESAQAKSCTKNSLRLKLKAFHWPGEAPFLLLRDLEAMAEQRKVTIIRPEPLMIPNSSLNARLSAPCGTHQRAHPCPFAPNDSLTVEVLQRWGLKTFGDLAARRACSKHASN
jgi:hypothetical protein